MDCVAARGGFPLIGFIEWYWEEGGEALLLCFGNLNNDVTNAGMSYSNRNNGLSNRNWNIGSRLYWQIRQKHNVKASLSPRMIAEM